MSDNSKATVLVEDDYAAVTDATSTYEIIWDTYAK